ncbi:hypothetical protein FJZ31_19825 [Candidatus Poribacteria bacterium]|nr:hypothetical protein [Candidatus Poribacteria bacterium]
MAIYWHPFLTQFLRQDYGSLLDIEDEVNLGDMPLRLDLLLISHYPVTELPYPFCHLGNRTLATYKGPGDTAGQESLVQLLTYALLYQQREEIWQRQDLTLWLLANEFADDIPFPGGANIADIQEIGIGVRGGTLDGFPVFLIDLGVLPVNVATLPLVMAAKGTNEQALVEFLLDNHEQYASYIGYLIELHGKMLMEVLMMREMTAEEIGLDMETVVRFLRFYSEDKVIDSLRKLYGDEKIIQTIDEERALKALAHKMGEERLRQIVEQLFPKESDNNND